MKKHNDVTLAVEVEYDRGEEKLQIPDTFVVAYDDKDYGLASARVKQDCAVLKLPKEIRGTNIWLD